MSYGDARVDDLLAEAEVYARYQIRELLEKQLPALLELPQSPAREAGRLRLLDLLGGAAPLSGQRQEHAYIEVPNRTLHPPVRGVVTMEGVYRRVPYDGTALEGLTAGEILDLLGSADSEQEGKFWYSNEQGSVVTRRGEQLVATEFSGAFPRIAPGRPYLVWIYDNMLGPSDSEETVATWFVFLLVPERVVIAIAGVPKRIDF